VAGVKVLQGIFLAVLTVFLSVAALLTASAFKWAEELPPVSEIEKLEYTATSQIFCANGRPIGEILPSAEEGGPATNRTLVSLDEVAPPMIWALVASEDDQFFNHYGFDILAIARATYEEFLGSGGRGGSTLTTQVAKNTLLADIAGERSLERKVKELMLAVELERRLTKAEILQQYLNVAYWGKNFYGVHAAARAYFGKDPIELNLAEGLYLARLLPAPDANYEDFTSTRRAMRVVLDNMVEQGVISQDAAERAWRYPLEPTGWRVQYDDSGEIVGEPMRTDEEPRVARSVTSDLNSHVAYTVRNEMEERFGDRLFRTGGFRIYTTIDCKAQEAANRVALDQEGYLPPGAQMALVSIDPETGGILAMVGGRLEPGQGGDTFNRATSARRQPGSSFKPIVVATALEQGGYTQATLISDVKMTFDQPGQEEAWTPRNHDNKFSGIRTLRYHLDQSRNIPIVKLVEAVTPQEVVARASQLGYQDLLPVPAIGLGAFEVTPLQHASALGAFANGGVHVEPHLIERVTDAEGNVLYEAQPRRTKVWSERTAYLMLDMLRGNVTDREPYGLSNRAAIEGRWVGGKTGTTNDDRDIWFVGLTPELVAAVWIGYDDHNRALPREMPNGEQVNSSRQPVWIWRDFAEEALAGVPPGEFTAPEGIVFEEVNLSTGAPSEEGTRVAFVRGTQPGAGGQQAAGYLNIALPIDTRTGERATAETPREYLEWREVALNEVQSFALPPQAAGQVRAAQTPQLQSAGGGTPPTSPPNDPQTGEGEGDVGWLDWGE